MFKMDRFHSFTLHHFVHQLDKYADAVLQKDFSISYSRFLCMVAIASTEHPTQHDIAEKMLVDDAVVSRMLKPLVKDGYVTIIDHPKHGRKKIVALTAHAHQLITKAADRLEYDYLYLAKSANIDPAELSSQIQSMHRLLDYKIN
jgi:DNA-binding MarR family transcriptional regulator